MRAVLFYLLSGFLRALLELSFGFTPREWLTGLAAALKQSSL